MSATGALTPLVGSPSHNGRPSVSRPASRAGDAGEPVLPPALARGSAFLALAVFGSLHWMAMLEPMAAARAWAAVGIGVLAMLALLAAERLSPRPRTLVAATVAVVAVGLAFLAAGLADEQLRPDRWGALASGVGRGIDALPGARVPYRGIDEWTRIVLALGGTLLVTLAALAAFWPRRDVTGRPLLALILLVLLYVVPAVALDFDGEFMRGALLVVLVLAFLRLERLRAREAGAAAGLAAAAAVLGLMLAPALDGNDPWWDYETWALTTAASQTTRFSWDHDYGPLDWPRDGREMLRVKARQQAYWKAQNLDAFNGRRWQRASYGALETPDQELPTDQRSLNRWTQTIEVSVRNLQSRTFVTAGIALGPPVMPNRVAFPAGPPGIWVTRRVLQRGDSYRARVYTPRPTERELRAAGVFYERDMTGFRSLRIDDPDAPSEQAERTRLAPAVRATFPAWGTDSRVVVRRESYRPGAGVQELRGERFLQSSDLRRTWELSKRLKEESDNPFEYVQAIESYLGSGFTYSESPPESALTLDGFLFDAKRGYCQQYSGAMALLLRMGGVPARVATGFTGGSLDSKTKEYVVRDLDAHSWVEAWFPDLGWVTFDPTPSSAPPRSQGEETTVGTIGDAPQFGSGGASSATVGLGDDGPPWWRIAGLTVLAVVLLALVALAVRRRRRRSELSPLHELERALRRTRRAPGPGATLQGLERAFGASPAAAAYVRALREQRYAMRREPDGPTGAQRRGLRAELARGGGLRARLRAWWALPPKPPARRRTLDMHG